MYYFLLVKQANQNTKNVVSDFGKLMDWCNICIAPLGKGMKDSYTGY